MLPLVFEIYQMFLWKFIMNIYTATSDLLKKWQVSDSVKTNTERHLLLGLHCGKRIRSDYKTLKNVTNHQKLMFLQQWTDLDMMYMYVYRIFSTIHTMCYMEVTMPQSQIG